jgi:hypothetical protein
MHYLEDVSSHFPNVKLRYIFYPDAELPSSFIPVVSWSR